MRFRLTFSFKLWCDRNILIVPWRTTHRKYSIISEWIRSLFSHYLYFCASIWNMNHSSNTNHGWKIIEDECVCTWGGGRSNNQCVQPPSWRSWEHLLTNTICTQTYQAAWKDSDALIRAWGARVWGGCGGGRVCWGGMGRVCVCLCSPCTQRVAAGWMACRGVSTGPPAKSYSFNSPKWWPWKIALYGMWRGVNSVSILTWVLSFSALWLPVVPDNINWTGRGWVRLTRSSGESWHQKTLQTHFSHGPLSHHPFLFLAAIKPAKVGTGSVTPPMQLNYTLFDCWANGVARLRWGPGRCFIHSLCFLNSWAPNPKQLTANLFCMFQKGERGEHAFCNFSCARGIKCSPFNFIKSLTTGTDTEDGKYARPENSQNLTVSISIKARCSTGCSNLIKPSNDKGFSLGSVGPRVHSSVWGSCGGVPGHRATFNAAPGPLWRRNRSSFVCGLL